ncbi:MAG: hypothetical protein PVJ67_01425 [Candidatus Pacearchaeota archaeon]|jgi:hypothetical protein
MKFYLFDGKNLTRITKSFNGRGVLGLFSVDEQPVDPNTIVFYEGGNLETGFHHPTEDFEIDNHGFQEFLQEQFNPDRYNVSGGLIGEYKMENGQIKIRWVDKTYEQKIFRGLIDKKFACGILHGYVERILN